MKELLKQTDKLDRTELYNAIYSLYEISNNVMIYRCFQDYSGNYNELYNAYAQFNSKECEQGLADYFLDNVLLETKKQVTHCYFVEYPVSTYIKFEALKVLVQEELMQSCFVTDLNLGEDFIIFDGAVIVFDVTKEGAITGGVISTSPADVEIAKAKFNGVLTNTKPFLKQVPAESSMANSLKRKIKQLKTNLNIK